MGIQKATSKAEKAYSNVRDNEYVRRVMEDEELRHSLIAAFLAGRKAVERISNNRASAVDSVTSDRKVKRELRHAAESLRDAAERIQKPAKKRHPIRKLMLAAVITGGLVLVFSESARNSVLDAIFGAEEEFVYTSHTGGPETNGAGTE